MKEPKVDSIVFDLDKTLIYTSTSSIKELYRTGLLQDPRFFEVAGRIYYFQLPEAPNKYPENGKPDTVSGMWGSMRPGARDFLRFCFQRFKRVIVFTAGTAEYAIAISKALFQGIGRPYMIWSRGHCVQIGERAVEVDKRLVDMKYYQTRAVQDDSEEMEYMNAKCLTRLAKVVSEFENNPSIGKDSFILVEDNYHSFITRDPMNSFFLSPYQSSQKEEISNIPGTPGYSPTRLQESNSGKEDSDPKTEKNQTEEDDLRSFFWMLHPETTLEKLREFISQNPDYSAEEYTRGWNEIYQA